MIASQVRGEQYTSNNYEGTQRILMNKGTVPKQALKQKHFHKHYLSYRHNGMEDWVTTLIERTDTLK